MKNFIKKNSATILTVTGAVGVGATAVVSARDTVKAMKRIEADELLYGFQTKKEKIKIAVPCYIPTIITGLSTILCIFGANKLNKRTQESIAAAYTLLNQTYSEYRNSVKDIYGVEGNRKIVQNVADKRIERDGAPDNTEGDLFFDFFSVQFFNSSLEKIREAEAAAKEMLRMHGYLSLATWYSFLGLNVNASDEMLGWSLGAGKLYGYDDFRLDIDEVVREDGLKYYVIDFVDIPTDEYLNL